MLVGIATGLWAGLPRNRGWIPGRERKFVILYSVQTGFGVHTASYAVGIGGFFSGLKLSGREADHLPPSTTEIIIMDLYFNPPYAFMVCCLIN
jgi:hypothetical protein